MLYDLNSQDIKDRTLSNRWFFSLMTSSPTLHFPLIPFPSIFLFILNYIKPAAKMWNSKPIAAQR